MDEQRRAYACTGEHMRSKKSFVADENGVWSRRVVIAAEGAEAIEANALELVETLFLRVSSSSVDIDSASATVDGAAWAGLSAEDIRATIQIQEGAISFRLDGTAPTNAAGEIASIGDYIELGFIGVNGLNQDASELLSFKAIAKTAADSLLVIRIYRRQAA